MKRLLPVFVFTLITLLSIIACEKAQSPESEQQAQQQTQHVAQAEKVEQTKPMPDGMGIQKVEESEHGPVRDSNIHGNTPPKKDLTVVVPDNVKDQWESVVLNLVDKEKGATEELTINLGDKKQIPDTNLTIVVGDFLPEFSLSGKERIVTSDSNTPNNPAVGIKVLEGEEQIYPEPDKNWGWLYKNFPQMHAFTHKRFEVYLKEGIPKK